MKGKEASVARSSNVVKMRGLSCTLMRNNLVNSEGDERARLKELLISIIYAEYGSKPEINDEVFNSFIESLAGSDVAVLQDRGVFDKNTFDWVQEGCVEDGLSLETRELLGESLVIGMYD